MAIAHAERLERAGGKGQTGSLPEPPVVDQHGRPVPEGVARQARDVARAMRPHWWATETGSEPDAIAWALDPEA